MGATKYYEFRAGFSRLLEYINVGCVNWERRGAVWNTKRQYRWSRYVDHRRFRNGIRRRR